MPESARRRAILLAERAAEIRGIVETPAKADIGNRDFFIQRIDQLRAAALQPARAQVGREVLSNRFKQFLQITRRDAFFLRYRCQPEIGVSEIALDGSTYARKERGLRWREATKAAFLVVPD